MHERPEGLDEAGLRPGLAAWALGDVALTYAPVGFGDYHWTAAGAGGRRWFVTVADLTDKPHCGDGPDQAERGLRAAMDTAWALRHQAGLAFVVAPLRTAAGDTVLRLDRRFAVSVFPFVDGTPGEFGQAPTPREVGQVVDLLAELHRTAPPATAPVLLPPAVPSRARLEAAVESSGRPWRGGPFAEPARELVAANAAGLRRRLAEFDRRVEALGDRRVAAVVTHGEPHPGNLLRQADRLLLLDWDTAGVAVPERDLWSVVTGPEDLARYAEATGHTPDPSALALYRLRWDLEDVAQFADAFRSPHARTADTELAWAGLAGIVARLTG